jgi:hypothetical protein
MRHSEFQKLIDAYLLGRLPEEETERFERHYFECPECFRETAERAAFIEAVKVAGPAPERESRVKRAPVRIRWIPLAWGAAGVILLAALTVLILPRTPRPPDFTDSGTRTVRGDKLTLLRPLGKVPEIPKEFSWSPVDGTREYSVVFEGIDPAWTAETRQTSIAIPADIVARIEKGKIYFWRVKAFSAAGALLAASDRAGFMIEP